MARIKLTKNELRDQQHRLDQLEKYLPTLQLKKMMFQTEVNNVISEIEELTKEYLLEKEMSKSFQSLLTDPESSHVFHALTIVEIEKLYENVAGAEIPTFETILFQTPR
jgi:V/A-type H+-transporting ATPase subunit D